MDDIMSFMIEAEALGLLTDTPPRIPQPIEPPKPVPRRGKKAAKAKREKVKP